MRVIGALTVPQPTSAVSLLGVCMLAAGVRSPAVGLWSEQPRLCQEYTPRRPQIISSHTGLRFLAFSCWDVLVGSSGLGGYHRDQIGQTVETAVLTPGLNSQGDNNRQRKIRPAACRTSFECMTQFSLFCEPFTSFRIEGVT